MTTHPSNNCCEAQTNQSVYEYMQPTIGKDFFLKLHLSTISHFFLMFEAVNLKVFNENTHEIPYG